MKDQSLTENPLYGQVNGLLEGPVKRDVPSPLLVSQETP